ncbi:FAD-binding domain-containing protein [Mycena galopus ATCC 62051]|nr:FAD-binding domain-containing protein [Mycena galopus ATCC 62051]
MRMRLMWSSAHPEAAVSCIISPAHIRDLTLSTMSFAHFPLVPAGLSTPPFYNNATRMALDDLFTSVGGRLFAGVPVAYPCFSDGPGDRTDCVNIRVTLSPPAISHRQLWAFINTQWETCQATGAQCLLESSASDASPTVPPTHVNRGAYQAFSSIDVRNAEDVAAAFNFSENTGMPLVIKNTGHDYKGRSSAANSIALWMTYDPAFVPEGCSLARPAATLEAGVQWAEAYEFADANNITVVGGSDRSVGAGGGHGVLSNTMGLGVDRVLQFRVVTPDGVLRVANACQNQDLFFALRGGGTFGVVLDATVLASPPVTLQAVIISWTSENRTLPEQLWNILVNNGLEWAADGWGGFSMSNTAILVNRLLDPTQAAISMAPLISFGQRLQQDEVPGAQTLVKTFPSFLAFFNAFTVEHVASVGTSLALASRLIPKTNFETPENRARLVDALQATNDVGPGMIILLVPPVSYVYQGGTSVTGAWRSSIYHVTAVSSWAWNATVAEKRMAYQSASTAIENLRRITPDAAYLNEADVYEPNHEVSFWGSHYPELLRIKQKYDPRRLLDCWDCVGSNPESSRFSCYL